MASMGLNSIVFVIFMIVVIKSEESIRNSRELIRMTPNFLTKARAFDIRRKQAKTWRNTTKEVSISPVCERNLIGLEIDGVAPPFRVFASEHSNEAKCRLNVPFKTGSPVRFAVAINGECGVKYVAKSQHTEYRLRVILSRNPLEVSEFDAIYDVFCRYDRLNVTVDSSYEISDFPPKSVYNEAKLPKCTYSIHRNGLTGEKTSLANLGETVFHRWTCPADFSFTVYRCFVHSGLDKSYMIVDDKGCSLDEEVLPHPTHDAASNSVYAAAKAFRFSTSRRVHFNCLLSVCHINDHLCKRKNQSKCQIKSQRKRHLRKDFDIEDRLRRIQHIMNGEEVSESEFSSNDMDVLLDSKSAEEFSINSVFSLSSNDIDVNEDSCSPTAHLHTLVGILFVSNTLSIFLTVIAFSLFFRNRYSVSIKTPSKTRFPHHFKF